MSRVEDIDRLLHIDQQGRRSVETPFVLLEHLAHDGFQPDVGLLVAKLFRHDREKGFHNVFEHVLVQLVRVTTDMFGQADREGDTGERRAPDDRLS